MMLTKCKALPRSQQKRNHPIFIKTWSPRRGSSQKICGYLISRPTGKSKYSLLVRIFLSQIAACVSFSEATNMKNRRPIFLTSALSLLCSIISKRFSPFGGRLDYFSTSQPRGLAAASAPMMVSKIAGRASSNARGVRPGVCDCTDLHLNLQTSRLRGRHRGQTFAFTPKENSSVFGLSSFTNRQS